MEIAEETILCELWQREFRVIKFSFKLPEDKEIINKFIEEGTELASKLNSTLARDSSRRRDFDTLKVNAIAGIISEFVWRYALNDYAKQQGAAVSFNKTFIFDIRNQIDIEVAYPKNIKKTVEVRSSFPYTGIKNGICKVFDIIGWYVNEVKKLEVRKDYYVRCLFPYRSQDFPSLLRSGFDAYLTGGATRNMLETSNYARDKEFIPYDEIVRENIKMTKYRVIEPIINAQDTQAIRGSIIKGL